jgi:hypothetical protein
MKHSGFDKSLIEVEEARNYNGWNFKNIVYLQNIKEHAGKK